MAPNDIAKAEIEIEPAFACAIGEPRPFAAQPQIWSPLRHADQGLLGQGAARGRPCRAAHLIFSPGHALASRRPLDIAMEVNDQVVDPALGTSLENIVVAAHLAKLSTRKT